MTVTIDDPAAVTDLAVRDLQDAGIDWSAEPDDLASAAAQLRGDLLNSVAGLVDPAALTAAVPGVEMTGARVWAEFPAAG